MRSRIFSKDIGKVGGVYENPFDDKYTDTTLNIEEVIVGPGKRKCIMLSIGSNYDHIILDNYQVNDLIKLLLSYKIC